MKGMYSGNEDWLSRQRWIPIVLVTVTVIGGWAVGSQSEQGVAAKDLAVQQVQPMAEKPQAPEQGAPEPMGGAQAPAVQPQSATADDAAKRMEEHKACLESAKYNPSIICK
jgi:hypothetical protein